MAWHGMAWYGVVVGICDHKGFLRAILRDLGGYYFDHKVGSFSIRIFICCSASPMVSP